MKPLYWVAIGLLLVIMEARTDAGFDIYPNPLGWLLVLVGLRGLIAEIPGLPLQLTLWYLGGLALVVSCALVAPAAEEWLDDAEDALIWAADLPALAFQALLAHGVAAQALLAGKRTSSLWWRICEVALLIGILGSMLYLAADFTWLKGVGEIGYLGALLFIVLCLIHGGRQWAGGGEPPELRPRRARGEAG